MPVMDITELVNIALEQNPELRALRNTVRAAEAIPPRVGSLDNPMFGVMLGNIPIGTLAFDRTPMSGIALSAMQKVPWPGKLQVRERQATYAAQATAWQYRQRAVEIIRDVKAAVYELYRIEKEIAITRANKELLEDLVKLTQARYEVGQAAQQDVLKAQVELSKMIDELVKLNQMRQTAVAQLNTLINRPPDAPIGRVPDVAPHEFDMSLEALMRAAEQTNPMLMMMRASIKAAEQAVHLAELNLKPNFQFGISYIIRSRVAGMSTGRDQFSFMANVIYPLYANRKEKMRIREQRARLSALQAQLDAQKNEIFFRIKDLYANIHKLRRQIELYRDGIIPQAEAALASARAAYMVGRVDFLNVLNSLLTLYNYQLAYYRIVANHERMLASLEAIIGARLFE